MIRLYNIIIQILLFSTPFFTPFFTIQASPTGPPSSLPSQLLYSPLPKVNVYINDDGKLVSKTKLPNIDLELLGLGKCKIYVVSSSRSLSLRFLRVLSEGLISYGPVGETSRSVLLSYLTPLLAGRTLSPPLLPGSPPRSSEERCKPPSIAFVVKDEGGWWGCNSKGEWERRGASVGSKGGWDAVRGVPGNIEDDENEEDDEENEVRR
jgi:hypothetical protein